jgi:ribose transport system substrate-binding protein
VGDDSIKYLLNKVGDKADILALTFHPGKLCIDRGVAFDNGIKGKSDLKTTYNEIVVPGQVQSGNGFAAAWLASHPEGGDRKLAIWSCWDEPMTGAVAALRQAGRTDVVTVSINGSPQALQQVKDGDMTATTWQPAYEEGKQVFQAILDSEAAGDSWKPKVISIPGVVVDKDNVDQFMKEHPAK